MPRNRHGNSIEVYAKWMALVFGFITTTLPAQDDQTRSRSQFLFPEFMSCQVKMKTGIVNQVTANYNTLSEKMVFLKDSTPQDMTVTTFVDTIIFADRQFVPFKEIFYEVLVNAPVSLFIQHKSTLIDPGQPSGYGGRSNTSAIDRVSILQSNNHYYNLPLPDEYNIVPSNVFWIRKDYQMFSFLNKRQLLKIFPEKSGEINEFISQHRLKTDNRDDMIILIQYYNSL